MTAGPINRQQIRFAAPDGYMLEGELFLSAAPKIAILVSAGTGFPHRVYARFAEWAAAQGAVVLTYDYRGIGGSRQGPLKGSEIEYWDWGRLDMTAALDRLEEAAPDLPLTHVAHSVGGHYLGLMPNHDKIARHAFVAVGSGYWGAHPMRRWPLEWYFWYGMGAFSLARWGYIPTALGWTGEPLPPRVFQSWRRWAFRKDYLLGDLDTLLAPQHYEAVTAPIRSWLFTDDGIATPGAASLFPKLYPNAPYMQVLRAPDEAGVPRIGHEGAFRKGREALWQEWWAWLSEAA
ncbi:alpha/beta hydrolase [Shimia sp. SDUM112013]|uniref:alpha/beta hydrolase family protein n=1 Tax=Shimia sp. SDUM112013 TaxID=3136160 RepID=UPI0032F059D5